MVLLEGTGLGNIIYDHGNNGLVLLAVVMAGLLAKTMGTKLIIFYCSCVWYNGNGGDIGTNDGKMMMMVVS